MGHQINWLLVLVSALVIAASGCNKGDGSTDEVPVGGDADADGDTESCSDWTPSTDSGGADSESVSTDSAAPGVDTGTRTPTDTGADTGGQDSDTLSDVNSGAFGDNPFVQTVYTADPAPMVYDGRLYVYTTHDEDNSTWFTMNDWRVYSTTDMVNWTDHGTPLAYTDFTWASGDAWAAQCAHRNGKFYMYVPINQRTGGNAIGVAVSDSPTGPFSDALGVPLLAGYGYIDPTVFVDDDGQAYLYWGNPNLYYVRLNEDMVSYSGIVEEILLTPESFGERRVYNEARPSSYEEGPWFYKRDDLYYMVFAAGPIPEHIGYSTSSGPTGPWTYRGVVMPTQGGSFTNHPGVVDYKGNSYLFYHNAALPGGGGFNRSVAVAQFHYGTDGSIPTMDMTTQGPPGVGSLNPYRVNEAETIAWEEGLETEPCSEGGMNVGFINDGDYIRVGGVNFGDGAASFEARVSSGAGGGTIELHLDSTEGTLVGTCAVPGTGGWQNWETVSCDVNGATGIHDLYLVFRGAGDYLFNFNWWQFHAL